MSSDLPRHLWTLLAQMIWPGDHCWRVVLRQGHGSDVVEFERRYKSPDDVWNLPEEYPLADIEALVALGYLSRRKSRHWIYYYWTKAGHHALMEYRTRA
ncbi:hypothetical protein [Deinococcus ficus]|uniref:hypothetical protein n=1 Tax=Deinococcus ficus TaxID=317577 RepID=UPI00174E8935|nr:hypothetical protein [Deinococcus ficus]GHF87248.1 hypothetical protein GCM10017782_25670 [Deinococcus ficus]